MKKEFLDAAKECYSALQKLAKSADPYDYELAYSKIMKEFERRMLEISISQLPPNRKKKKSRYG